MKGDAPALLLGLVQQIGMLREDLSAQPADWDTYKARVARIDRMIATLAASFVDAHPELSDAIVAASQTPERSLERSASDDHVDAFTPASLDTLLAAIEKVGLLRRDMQHRRELERYEPRFSQITERVSALAEQISTTDPAASKALTTAWQLPARSLAFRNAAHQKEMKKREPGH